MSVDGSDIREYYTRIKKIPNYRCQECGCVGPNLRQCIGCGGIIKVRRPAKVVEEERGESGSKYNRLEYVQKKMGILCGNMPRSRLNDTHLNDILIVYREYATRRNIKKATSIEIIREALRVSVEQYNSYKKGPKSNDIRVLLGLPIATHAVWDTISSPTLRIRNSDAHYIYHSQYPVSLPDKVIKRIYYHWREVVENCFGLEGSYETRSNFSFINILLGFLLAQVNEVECSNNYDKETRIILSRLSYPRCSNQKNQLLQNLRDICALHNSIYTEQWEMDTFLLPMEGVYGVVDLSQSTRKNTPLEL